jgi:uncharacterized protein with von Willebrand factor type A (vWA) domain
MAKKKKEEVLEIVEETPQTTNQQDSGDENVVKVDESKFESAGDDGVIKVDLSNPPPQEDKVEEAVTEVTDNAEVQPEAETQETPVLEEITEEGTEEEVTIEATAEAIAETEVTGDPLPENIQKLMDFMEDTGGDLNDYVKLNQDYSALNDEALLKEYYTTKMLTKKEI